MITTSRIVFITLAFLILATLSGCSPENSDDDIPFVPFADVMVNLGLPENFSLQYAGSHKIVNGGVKGIILYHHSNGNFYAFERNCSFTPLEVCATVEV